MKRFFLAALPSLFQIDPPVLRQKGYALLMAALIVAAGMLVSRLLVALTRRLLARYRLNEAVGDLLIAFVRWGSLLLALLVAAGVLMTGVFGMPSQGFNAIAGNLLRAVGTFAVGCAVVGVVANALRRVLEASRIDPALHSFLLSAAKALLLTLLTIGCIEMLGISTASIVAALASVGLALSLSVKDHLSNLIGGLVILVTKPFTVGDYVQMDGSEGTVDKIDLIYTVLVTFDNKKVFIPNNDASKARITNFSAEDSRRLDLTFSIGYQDNYEQARAIILEVARETGLLLPEPGPVARMSAHSASSIDIACRLWVRWSDYYELNYQMRERVKTAFDEAGVSIPYQQLDLHIISRDSQNS